MIYQQFNGKSGENDGKITEIKLLGEDTINLNISELSSSSVILWTSTHTIRDRTLLNFTHLVRLSTNPSSINHGTLVMISD